MGVRRFTYFCDDSFKLSNLTDSWFAPISCLASPRSLSQLSHKSIPITLRLFFGPLLNILSLPHSNSTTQGYCRDNIDQIVFFTWVNYNGHETANKLIYNKLKVVKLALINWRRAEFEREHKSLIDIKAKMIWLVGEVENRALSNVERSESRDGKKKIVELENLVRFDLQQKSKVKWLTEDDENTSFYHNFLKIKSERHYPRPHD